MITTTVCIYLENFKHRIIATVAIYMYHKATILFKVIQTAAMVKCVCNFRWCFY